MILMQYNEFEEHGLHWIQKWVRVNREGPDTHVFEDIEDKEEGGQVMVESDAHETPIDTITRYDLNALLEDGYEVENHGIPAPDNKPITIFDHGHSIY